MERDDEEMEAEVEMNCGKAEDNEEEEHLGHGDRSMRSGCQGQKKVHRRVMESTVKLSLL